MNNVWKTENIGNVVDISTYKGDNIQRDIIMKKVPGYPITGDYYNEANYFVEELFGDFSNKFDIIKDNPFKFIKHIIKVCQHYQMDGNNIYKYIDPSEPNYDCEFIYNDWGPHYNDFCPCGCKHNMIIGLVCNSYWKTVIETYGDICYDRLPNISDVYRNIIISIRYADHFPINFNDRFFNWCAIEKYLEYVFSSEYPNFMNNTDISRLSCDKGDLIKVKINDEIKTARVIKSCFDDVSGLNKYIVDLYNLDFDYDITFSYKTTLMQRIAEHPFVLPDGTKSLWDFDEDGVCINAKDELFKTFDPILINQREIVEILKK